MWSGFMGPDTNEEDGKEKDVYSLFVFKSEERRRRRAVNFEGGFERGKKEPRSCTSLFCIWRDLAFESLT